MPDSLSDLQRDIADWTNKTFPKRTVGSILAHLSEEIDELNECVNAEEIADCVIMLADLSGIIGVDLYTAIVEKMEVNKRRTWQEPDELGIVRHVK